MRNNLLWLLSWLQEVALLLWVASLTFLPWFRDPRPGPGQTPLIFATDLIIDGGHTGILYGFLLGLLAYLLSRFSKWKWPAVPVLIAACFVFFTQSWLCSGMISFDNCIPGRISSTLDNFPSEAGVDMFWFGVIALGIGLAAAKARHGRTAPLKAIAAVIAVVSLYLAIGIVVNETLFDLFPVMLLLFIWSATAVVIWRNDYRYR